MEDSDFPQFAARQEHLEGEVDLLRRDIAPIKAAMPLVIEQLKDIATKVNAPPDRTNWFGLVGAFVSVVVVMGAGISLMIEPISVNLDRMNTFLGVQNERYFQESKVVGTVIVEAERLRKDLTHLDERSHWTENRIIEMEKQDSGAKVSRKAIGEYTKGLAELVRQHQRDHP
tara:strand:+ start:3418 stop:3933 length:516 start_codon:yes stop_codon:yes gene_type:complete